MSVRLGAAFALLAGVVAVPGAEAQTLATSPETTIEVGPSDLVVADEAVVVDDLAATVFLMDLGALPSSADVTGFGLASNGDRLFSLATTTELPGPVTAEPRDVVRYDGASYAIEVDGSAAGVPRGVRIDAVSSSGADWTLSFDTTVDLGGVLAEDEDLVLWNGSAFSLVFDGSAEGLAAGLDVDAVLDLGGGDYLLSLDSSADVGGVFADDEDVLRFESGTGFSLEFDASTADVDWAATDLVAVPEPGWLTGMASGVALLAALRRRRAAAARTAARARAER